ncbi:nucleotidyl transferase AbiEii/AbiGii toxin family protein [Candidatus Margulisiibacteriota bacterium]
MKNNGILLLTNKEKLKKQLLFTQSETGFSPLLLEKDYYLTVLLIQIAEASLPLIFKGGTCLNKCYLGFYRLSEDLDFMYDFNAISTRPERRNIFKEIEKNMLNIINLIPDISLINTFKFNKHQQLQMHFSYESVFGGKSLIKFEVNCQYPLEIKSESQTINHLFKHPFTGQNIISEYLIKSISLLEAVSEKIRACLTRKVLAIRDYFDVWYLKKHFKFDFSHVKLKKLIQTKLKQYDSIIDIKQNYGLLKRQIKTELEPTLQTNAAVEFDLKETMDFVLKFSIESA